MSLSRNLRYPAIDGLRFYAAFIVFLVHMLGSIAGEYFRIPESELRANSDNPLWGLLAYAADGHHGVDVFFIISGFLMAKMLIGRWPFDYFKFIGNRFRRIYPAFLASLAVVTLIKVLVFDWEFDLQQFLLNLIIANAIPESGVIPYNFVTWSLGYEFAFYLVVPILVITRWIPAPLAGAMLLAAAMAIIPDSIIRAKALFFGCLIGCMSDQTLRDVARRIPLLPLLGAYILVLAAKSLGALDYVRFYLWFLPITSLFFVAIVFGDNLINRMFSLPVFRELGTISYSLYLWHPICIALVFTLVTKLGAWPASASGAVLYAILGFLLSLSVSRWSYALFEASYFKKREPSVSTASLP